MKIRRIQLYKLHIILGIIVIISAGATFLLGSTIRQEKNEYREVGGEIVVIFEEEIGEGELHSLINTYHTTVEIVRHIGDYALLYVRDATKYDSVLVSLRDNQRVQAVQENYSINTLSFSKDTYSETQWAIDNPGYYVYLSKEGRKEKTAIQGVDMDVVEAWKTMNESMPKQREVVVAIIDTGVDYSHPDLAENMWMNKGEIDGDKIDNDNNGYVDDVFGWDFYNDDANVCHYAYSSEFKTNVALPEDNDNHGTHIAGIIGAVANNNIGIAGVASNIDVKLMSLKINGGPKGSGNISDAIEAIKYATMMGADICNLSWGTSFYSEALELVMRESDILFIAAAGNEGTDNKDYPIYPANLKLDNLISVTFIDATGEMTSLSNYGKVEVDLAAPGEDIYSTVVGRYEYMSGSSMAAPHVSAVAAMLYAYSDHLYPSNVKEILLNNIKPLPSLKGRMKYAGVPSAHQAVVASNSLVQDIDSPKLSFETIYKKGDMIIPIKVEDKGDSKIRVIKWMIGDRLATDFLRGMKGTAVEENQITVSKAGIYTFYAADYAGNETIKSYQIVEDSTAPKISATYSVASSYKSRTVTVKASDQQSGIKRVKYMSGVKKAEDFLPTDAGTDIELKKGNGTFKVKKDGTYTIFASDHRGNMSVKQITVKTIKITEIKYIRDHKILEIGNQYTQRVFFVPIQSTDKITYVSSDKTIATVTSTGKVKALAEGTTKITARTSSGLTASYQITVKKAEISAQ